jgi:phosphate:Na+ symporter
MGQNRFAGILAGTVATAAVQSSSAITGLLVAMGISNTISLPGAIAILLGANIGTCVTGFIASLRLSRASRRTSVAQILINVMGVLLFLPILSPFTALVLRTSGALSRQIANAHSIFNVAVSVVLFPFVQQITRLAEWLVPEGKRADEPALTAYIDERLVRIPQVAIRESLRELCRLGSITAEMVEHSGRALLQQDVAAAEWVVDRERAFVDPVCNILEMYVNALLQRNLSPEQQRRCFQIKNLITDVERIGDLAEDLAEAAQLRVQHRVVFSPSAVEELDRLCQHAHRTVTHALDAVRDNDRTMAEQACLLESEFDALYLEARQGHIHRLETGICQPEADVLFVEAPRNLERICDHADNLGVSVSRN